MPSPTVLCPRCTVPTVSPVHEEGLLNLDLDLGPTPAPAPALSSVGLTPATFQEYKSTKVYLYDATSLPTVEAPLAAGAAAT